MDVAEVFAHTSPKKIIDKIGTLAKKYRMGRNTDEQLSKGFGWLP